MLTLYKWFTRNSETDMRKPMPQAMLHDRNLVNVAEAFLRKKMKDVPLFSAHMQPRYTVSQSTQGMDLTLNMGKLSDISMVHQAFVRTKPVRHKQEVLTSKEDREKYGK